MMGRQYAGERIGIGEHTYNTAKGKTDEAGLGQQRR